jgi:hypothetical protein
MNPSPRTGSSSSGGGFNLDGGGFNFDAAFPMRDGGRFRDGGFNFDGAFGRGG